MTFNGGDYDHNGFTFTFFNIARAFPRSGPSNGQGGPILIKGEGFRADSGPLCRLNNTVYDPISVSWGEIKCPMPRAPTDDYFGNVEFAVTANGHDWHEFEGGFQYYEQIVVKDIYPKTGPAKGLGVINFYGDKFRSDFPLAELGCKVGNSVGQAVFISDKQISCVIEDMETVPEGENQPA